MADKRNYQFDPDYAVAPGETLQETLEHYGMSQADLAIRTGKSRKCINEIIKGKSPITPDTALEFERVLGVPAGFWNNLEKNYQDVLVRIEEKKRLEGEVQWLNKFPIAELTRWGMLPQVKEKTEKLSTLFNFLGVSSSDAWQNLWRGKTAVFRKSNVFNQSPEAVSTWLRIGELKAQKMECPPFNKNKFRESLEKIRQEFVHVPIDKAWPDLVASCAQSGVVVVCIPELDKTHLSGATHWLNPHKAIIQLSFRYRSDDHFWFTFFHEAGHIIKHGKKEGFIDDGNFLGKKEMEANQFAADILTPPKAFNMFLKNKITKTAICDFADKIRVARGVVVGRLQHERRLKQVAFNDLKIFLDKAQIEELAGFRSS